MTPALHTFLLLALAATGDPPAAEEPAALRVEPASVELAGLHAICQLLVTARYADGSERDVTSSATLRPEQAGVVRVEAAGLVAPLKEGTTILVVEAGRTRARVPVKVSGLSGNARASFRNDVIAVLNVAGCNAGTCHGSPHGKGGFHLSLRGYDPAADYLELTRNALGRRVDRHDPDASLILQKALGTVPHEGGRRFTAGSRPARLLRAWLAEGLADDAADAPAVTRHPVLPGPRKLRAPARRQQLAVLAHFADGTVRDVTPLTLFASSDAGIADVSETGAVEFTRPGEVAIQCQYLGHFQSVRLSYLEPQPGFRWPNPPENNYVDTHVFAKLRELEIVPSELCSDEEFVRRAYLDLCGVLPTAAAARAFRESPRADKRARLIDELLQSPEYADFWALKWADVLRVRQSTHRAKGAAGYQHWLREHIDRNTPLDQLARALLTARGNTFTDPAANYFRIGPDTGYLREEEVQAQLTETTAQVFCGVRIQCAKCHNHPRERWTQDDYYGLAAFFGRVRRKKDPAQPPAPPRAKPRNPGAEVVYLDRAGEVVQPRTRQTMAPKFLGGAVADVPEGADRREALADWLTGDANPFFARAAVNRLWFHLLGRGIVDPVDDFRASNPPANEALLDALARDFTAHRFDVKHVLRVIMNSRTYQLSAATNPSNRQDAKYFSHALVKLHTAEQLLDAVSAATEVPEKFPDFPLGTRAAQLPDVSVKHEFLQAFHKPARDMACECERGSDASLPQALQLLNGDTVNAKLRTADNRIGRLLARKAGDRELLAELYLATLSRPPTAAEEKVMLAHVAKAADARAAWEDVQRALLNSHEFLFRH